MKYFRCERTAPPQVRQVVVFNRALSEREWVALQGNPMRALGLLRPETPRGKKGRAGKRAAFAHQARALRRAASSFKQAAEQPLNAEVTGNAQR